MGLERTHKKGNEEKKQRALITYSIDNKPFTTGNGACVSVAGTLLLVGHMEE